MDASGRGLGLSDILTMGSPRINPLAQQAERSAEAVCREWDIYPPNFSGFVTMSAYLFPRASLERLETIILTNNFLYFVDDTFDRHNKNLQQNQAEQARRNDEFARIFAASAAPERSDHLHVVCDQLRKRYTELSTKSWLERFAAVLGEHLRGAVVTQPSEELLELDAYLSARLVDAGMRPTIALIEFANDSYLHESVIEDDAIKQMEQDCAMFAALSNDLFSYEKEVMAHGSRFNLIPILMHRDASSFDEAVHVAVSIINDHARRFLENAEAAKLRFEDHPEVLSYIEGLREQFIASWHWQISTPRYRSPHSPFAELRMPLR